MDFYNLLWLVQKYGCNSQEEMTNKEKKSWKKIVQN